MSGEWSCPGAQSFRALVEHGLDILELVDAAGQILYASPSVERVLGYKPEELLGANAFDFLPPEDAQDHHEWFEHILAHPEHAHHREARIRHKDGSRRHFSVSVQNLLDQPEVGALVINARDVTRQKENERRLQEQATQLRILAENARDIIIVFQLRPEPKHAYVSPSVERILGYSRQEFYENPHIFRRIVHPEDRATMEALVGASAEKLAELRTTRCLHREGHTVWLDYRSVLVGDERGAPSTLYVIARDVTEKVRLEEQLRRSQGMEALGRLAGGMAHDFNNLLSAALLSSDRLKRMSSGEPRLLQGLEEVRAAIDRGISLTRQLLAFSQRDPEPARPLDVHRAVSELEPVLRRLIPEDISLEVELRADRPVVRIGRSELEQVILNLTLNARDAMPEGGHLVLECEDLAPGHGRPRELALSVRDDGVGMDEQERTQLFEPYFTTKPSGGYGLGMAVVHSVVERTDGAVRVESSRGRGTEIRIDWPVCAEEPEPDEATALSDGPAGASEAILVVEDDAALRRLTVEVLTARGYLAHAAADGEEARRALTERAFDLLLTDMVIPRGSGRGLAEQLRREGRKTAVIYMSGYSAEARKSRESTGGARFLTKPFTEATLARTVREALDRR